MKGGGKYDTKKAEPNNADAVEKGGSVNYNVAPSYRCDAGFSQFYKVSSDSSGDFFVFDPIPVCIKNGSDLRDLPTPVSGSQKVPAKLF
ncbi:MAG: hypothetical protein KGI50_06120 [Patescibacteria group bacterium]|nr:hypothetical protein [Patescibacteria group bacterium]MDE2439082.1 hypothetical protein [Patescibacteria group bacterium]